MSVDQALADRARGAGMTTRLFDERLRGLPADALVRIEGNAALIPLAQQVQGRLGAVAEPLRADGPRRRHRAARAPARREHTGRARRRADRPGAAPPAPLGRTNGATAGIRDLRHVIRFGLRTLKERDPGTYRRYDLARRG